MKVKNKLFKPTVIAIVLATSLVGGNVFAATVKGESGFSKGIQGWAPYLPSVGTKYVNSQTQTNPRVGDIIEVPTYLFDDVLYTYADGNGTQDKDPDNKTRVRAGQLSNLATGITQKVSVHWYIVDAVQGKEFAPEGATAADLNDAATNPTWVRSWDDVVATPVDDDAYNVPYEGQKSLALKVPPAAVGKRVGFIIVPESQTGIPARGAPLKVPDINFIWGQTPPEGPGELCDVPPPNILENNGGDVSTWTPPEECKETPTDPGGENPGNGGGEVEKSDYIVNIYKYPDSGAPNPKKDAVLGSTAHPIPLVNTKYYAEILVLEANPDEEAVPVYRELTPSEAESITWSIYNPKVINEINALDEEAIDYKTQFDAVIANNLIDDLNEAEDEALRTADNNYELRMGSIGGADSKMYYTFRTQTDNPEGTTTFAQILQKWTDDISINGENSEQGTLLRVSFDYDDTIGATP